MKSSHQRTPKNAGIKVTGPAQLQIEAKILKALAVGSKTKSALYPKLGTTKINAAELTRILDELYHRKLIDTASGRYHAEWSNQWALYDDPRCVKARALIVEEQEREAAWRREWLKRIHREEIAKEWATFVIDKAEELMKLSENLNRMLIRSGSSNRHRIWLSMPPPLRPR